MTVQDDINALFKQVIALEERVKQEQGVICRWYRKVDSGRAPGYELRLKLDQRYLGYFGATKYGSENLAFEAMQDAAKAVERATT